MVSEWHQLSSSWIVAARVDRDENFLDLKFKDGAICRYAGASNHFDAIVGASSAGQYLNANLKGWPYTQVAE